jgi:hypothetical protein
MKKSKRATSRKSIKPIGRSPVITVRVNGRLYDRITKSAKDNKRPMSEEMAALIQRGFDWNDAFEAGLLAKGFQRLHGSSPPQWVKLPEETPKGFLTKEQAATFFDRPAGDAPLTEAAINELDKINAALDGIEDRVRKIREETGQ